MFFKPTLKFKITEAPVGLKLHCYSTTLIWSSCLDCFEKKQ
uniref:Uncharacterized protein n=1 Tax=Anguilla anguilla TaxID=7936 RepID=A0A0E9QXC1_ANGAN